MQLVLSDFNGHSFGDREVAVTFTDRRGEFEYCLLARPVLDRGYTLNLSNVMAPREGTIRILSIPAVSGPGMEPVGTGPDFIEGHLSNFERHGSQMRFEVTHVPMTAMTSTAEQTARTTTAASVITQNRPLMIT